MPDDYQELSKTQQAIIRGESDRAYINQLNAQHSTGPVTDIGKEISSHNSVKHNFFTRLPLTNPEDQLRYTALSEDIYKELLPLGTLEMGQAQVYADCQWRLDHIAEYTERLLMEIRISDDCIRDVDRFAKSFALYSLYERRIQSTQAKALVELKKLQADRQAEEARRQAEEQAKLDEAIKLEKLAQLEETEWNPEEYGFVFSREYLGKELRRRERLARAEKAFKATVQGPKGGKNTAPKGL